MLKTLNVHQTGFVLNSSAFHLPAEINIIEILALFPQKMWQNSKLGNKFQFLKNINL